jgi:hypothetical protein
MKDNKSNLLLYGLILGGIVGAGLVIYFGSKFVIKKRATDKMKKHKFYEGIDDIFNESAEAVNDSDDTINSETENEIVDELFSRSN